MEAWRYRVRDTILVSRWYRKSLDHGESSATLLHLPLVNVMKLQHWGAIALQRSSVVAKRMTGMGRSG